jgi:hypothetical protein
MDEVTADKSAAAGDHQIINIHVTPFPLILTSIFTVKRYVSPALTDWHQQHPP